jgi:TctA family transporter
MPPAPMVLGMLLGNMVEQSYVRMLGIARGTPVITMFLTRPICVVLLVLIALSLLSTPVLTLCGKWRKAPAKERARNVDDDFAL